MHVPGKGSFQSLARHRATGQLEERARCRWRNQQRGRAVGERAWQRPDVRSPFSRRDWRRRRRRSWFWWERVGGVAWDLHIQCRRAFETRDSSIDIERVSAYSRATKESRTRETAVMMVQIEPPTLPAYVGGGRGRGSCDHVQEGEPCVHFYALADVVRTLLFSQPDGGSGAAWWCGVVVVAVTAVRTLTSRLASCVESMQNLGISTACNTA